MGCFSSRVKVQGERPKEPTYKGRFNFFGPSVSGDVYATQCKHLYKVCTADTWYFYNDTREHEFRIMIDFGPVTHVVPGETKTKPGRADISYKTGKYHGGTRCTAVVYPFETIPFVKFAGEKNIDCYDDTYDCQYIKNTFIKDKISLANRILSTSTTEIVAALKRDPSMTLDAVVKNCIMNKTQFVDYTFSPASRSIEPPDKDPHAINHIDSIRWMRSVDIVPAELQSKVQLYRRGIKPKWVVQGYIGDCWLISAITIISQKPELTRRLFKHPISASHKKKERKIGAYRVWLNLGGWWTNVIVDNYLPTKDLSIAFASSDADPFSLWVPLIEKAYAKAHGSYAALVGGLTGDGIRDLTGFPYFDVDTKVCVAASRCEVEAEYFFADLLSWIKRKFVISIGTPGTDTSDYVINNNNNNNNTQTDTSSLEEDEEASDDYNDDDDDDDDDDDNDDGEDEQENASDSDSCSAGEYDFKDEIYETESDDSSTTATTTTATTTSFDEDRPWICPSEEAYDEMGLVMGHAYCILDVCKLPGSNIRLVKVRNPHGGNSTWKGKWGNTSDVWKRHPVLKLVCKPNLKDNDGTFWMDWRDVVKWFEPNSFSVNMLKPKWRDYRIKGAFKNKRPSVVLRIDVKTDKDIPFYFSISFKSARAMGGRTSDNATMCRLLLSWDDYEEDYDNHSHDEAELTYLEIGRRKIPIGRARNPANPEDGDGDDEPTKQFLVAASSPNGDVPFDLLDEEDAAKVGNIYSDQVTMSYELSGPMSPYYLIPVLSPACKDVPYVLSVFCPQKASSSTYDVSFVEFPTRHPVFSGAKSFDYIDGDAENDKLVTCYLQSCRSGRAPTTSRGTSLLDSEVVPYEKK